MKKNPIKIVDVRRESEHESGHVENSLNIPLDFMNDHMAEFPQNDKFYVHCAGGYRSVIASSILKSRGMHDLANVEGGFKDIKTQDIRLSDKTGTTT